MKPRDLFLTRREMLSRCGMGMGLVALTSTLGEGGFLQAIIEQSNHESAGPETAPRFPPRPSACCTCS